MKSILLTLILSLTLSTPIYAGPNDPVHFECDNLKVAVEATLGTTNPTEADMAGMTTLTAPYYNIADLSGLEYAINLTNITLFYNNINDITPLAELNNLTRLHLSHNNINDITEMANMGSLTILYLSDNNISNTTPLAKLTNLKNLYLYGNNINDITPLAELTSLTNLTLHANPLHIAAYTNWLPMIEANNPDADIRYDDFTGGIDVLSPTGGETLLSGRTQLISWNSELLDSVDISYSLDNGDSWIWIANAPSPENTTNRYIWDIPQLEVAASECLIRIEAVDYPAAADTSDTTFTIIPCTLKVRDGDINDDCVVDLLDFAIIANNWLADGRE